MLWDGNLTRDKWLHIKAMVLQFDPNEPEAEQVVRMALERRSTRNINEALQELLNTLYPQGWGEFADPNIEAQRIHELFMRDQRLRDAVSRAVQDAADLGVSVAVDTLGNVGFGFDYTLANTSARDWALRYTDEILSNLANTTSRGVGQAVGRWIQNGEPLEMLIRDLSPYFGRQRAERIAATEVTRAFAEGNRTAYQESGVVVSWEWRTARDERVCPICGPLNEKQLGLDTSNDWRGYLPDEILQLAKKPINGPPAHPNCRCWAVPVIAEVQR